MLSDEEKKCLVNDLIREDATATIKEYLATVAEIQRIMKVQTKKERKSEIRRF